MLRPNPLFEKWLTEMRDEARAQQSKAEHSYNTALKYLKKYNVPLQSGRDCRLLKGFGDKICDMLDEKLEEHRRQGGAEIIAETNKQTKSPRVNRAYVPAANSGPYAILRALYEKSLEGDYKGYLTKEEIITVGQKYSTKSFTKADPGKFYTAWSSMSTLIQKFLVIKKSSPAKYYLTDQGLELAEKLYLESIKDIDSGGNNAGTTTDDNIEAPRPNKTTSTNSDCLEKVVKPKRNVQNKKVPQPPIERFGSSSSTASTTSGSGGVVEEFVTLLPNTFEVVLVVDNGETHGMKSRNDSVIRDLKYLKVPHEVRNLKVGDYTWIARDLSIKKTELVLPYIIERKRMDDLSSSIKDGRFYEQKFRLRQSGIQNLIYLVEKYEDKNLGLPINSLYQGIANTLVQDGFCVKVTDGLRGSAEYLACLTNLLKANFEQKTLISCAKDDLPATNINDDLVSLMPFPAFNRHSVKTKQMKVKDLFTKQLLKIKGVSVEKAQAVTEKYPTPKVLQMALKNKPEKEAEAMLANIKFGTSQKKIGPVLSRTVYQFLLNKDFP